MYMLIWTIFISMSDGFVVVQGVSTSNILECFITHLTAALALALVFNAPLRGAISVVEIRRHPRLLVQQGKSCWLLLHDDTPVPHTFDIVEVRGDTKFGEGVVN